MSKCTWTLYQLEVNQVKPDDPTSWNPMETVDGATEKGQR